MITLQKFREQTQDLPSDSELGITYDSESGTEVISIRPPDSQGHEILIDCGDLPSL